MPEPASQSERSASLAHYLSLRRWLNRNSTTATLVAVGVLVASLAYVAAGIRDAPRPAHPHAYYFDLNTGKLFVDDAEQFAPIAAPSGPLMVDGQPTDQPAGVRAYVYACYDCSDVASRFVGWLEQFTDEARLAAENAAMHASQPDHAGDDDSFDTFERGHLMRAPDGDQWVQRSGKAGLAIMTRALQTCGRDRPAARACHPSTDSH